jgi:hypothetical protein
MGGIALKIRHAVLEPILKSYLGFDFRNLVFGGFLGNEGLINRAELTREAGGYYDPPYR